VSQAAPVSLGSDGPGLARGWVALARLFSLAVFAQSIFAGFLLSGYGWGRTAHEMTAYALVLAAPLAAIVAAVTAHHSAAGRRLALLLGALAVGLAAQTVVGIVSASGQRLMWIHVPLGVILIALAAGLQGATATPAGTRGTRVA